MMRSILFKYDHDQNTSSFLDNQYGRMMKQIL